MMKQFQLCIILCVPFFIIVSAQRCPTGWFAFQDRCFYTDQTYATDSWYEARDLCVSMGGQLAIIDNVDVNSFLHHFTKENCWIGANDIDEEGKFYWVDGSRMSKAGYQNWGPDEPSIGTENNCVDLRKTGYWNAKYCEEIRWTGGYMCEQPIGPLPTGYNTPKCTDGWFLFEDRCFWVDQVEANRTWYSARDQCIAMGGTLAIVDSKEVQDFLEYFTTEDCWFGLHDLDDENEFYWVDGRSLASTGYKNWEDYNPNEDIENINDCVEIQKNGKWNDKPCNQIQWTVGVMCQKEAERTSTPQPTTTTSTSPITTGTQTTGGMIAVIVFSTLNFVLLLAMMVYVFLQHYRQRDGNSTGTTFSKGNMSVDLGFDNEAYNINKGEGFDTKP